MIYLETIGNLIRLFVITLVVYCVVSFLLVQWNPFQWPDGAKVISLLAIVMFNAFAYTITNDPFN